MPLRSLSNFSINGLVPLYHFSQNNKPTLILDPKKFGTNSFTFNDVKACAIKRIFFYINLKHKEPLFTSNLYKVVVPENQIYDLNKDELNIKELIKKQHNGVLIPSCVMAEIRYNTDYKGVFYGEMPPMVAWFYPIRTELVNENIEKKLPKDRTI